MKTFISYSKIERSDEVDYFIFKTFFNDSISRAVDKYGQGTPLYNINDLSFMEGKTISSLRSSDSIRLKNAEKEIEINKNSVFEYILISMFSNVLKYFYKKKG